MTESLAKNFIDYEEYPQTAEIQNRCVSMIGRLFNAPIHDEAAAIGTSTVGSSEAVMLAALAMKKRWQNKRKAEGKPYDKPNMIMSSAVQVVWEKAMRYFEIEEKYVYCTPTRYVIYPKETVDLIDENTVSRSPLLSWPVKTPQIEGLTMPDRDLRHPWHHLYRPLRRRKSRQRPHRRTGPRHPNPHRRGIRRLRCPLCLP